MLGGVLVGRVIAAADVTTRPAYPQMHPLRTDLEALFASARARLDVADASDMAAVVAHGMLRSH